MYQETPGKPERQGNLEPSFETTAKASNQGLTRRFAYPQTSSRSRRQFHGQVRSVTTKERLQSAIGGEAAKRKQQGNQRRKQTAESNNTSLQPRTTKRRRTVETKQSSGLPFQRRLASDSPAIEAKGSLPSSVLRPMVLSSERQMFQSEANWFDAALPNIVPGNSSGLSQVILSRLLAYGRELLEQESQYYANSISQSSSQKFYLTVMSSGTFSDKVSALTLSVQESPLHNTRALETLVALARKRSRDQAIQVLGALKDLFSAGSLLPSNRRLKAFTAQPSWTAFSETDFANWSIPQPLPSPLQKVHLIAWAFEDRLKEIYFGVVKLLEIWCNDEIVFARLKAVDYVYELLREKPEQEANLLRLLVNKLGDPERQVASRVSVNLVQIQLPHPFMKPVIISALESDVLFKRSQSLHAKYYAITILNQTILDGQQQDVIAAVLKIYFALFMIFLERQRPLAHDHKPQSTNAVGEKGFINAVRQTGKGGSNNMKFESLNLELKDKLLAAILTGINRAYPFISSRDDFFDNNLDVLFKITHSSNFNTSLQALMLLQQLCRLDTPTSDRFYRTLYESLLDPRLLTTTKQALYINLLFRAMKADPDHKRLQAFLKRIFQIAALHQPAFACVTIYLAKELETQFPGLHTLLDQPEAAESEDENRGSVSSIRRDSIGATQTSGPDSSSYNGRKRDPQFSNAEKTCLWEMDALLRHFHPSVSLSARKFLEHDGTIDTKPDLSLHTLISFLDRFAYRKPKKVKSSLRGASIMQPLAATGAGTDLLISARRRYRSSSSLLNNPTLEPGATDAQKPDETFFHQYFNAKAKRNDFRRKGASSRQTVDSIDPAAEEVDGNNEEHVWKALVDSQPQLDADDDTELDLESITTESESAEESGIGSSPSDPDSMIGEDIDASELDMTSNAGNDADNERATQLEEQDALRMFVRQPHGRTADARKRRRLNSLPTFASAEDYAQLFQEDNMSEGF